MKNEGYIYGSDVALDTDIFPEYIKQAYLSIFCMCRYKTQVEKIREVCVQRYPKRT